MSSGVTTDIDIIDQLDVRAVAEALSIGPQAVSKWKQRGLIPEARHNQPRNVATAQGLAMGTPVESDASSLVAAVNRLPMGVPPGCCHRFERHSRAEGPTPTGGDSARQR